MFLILFFIFFTILQTNESLECNISIRKCVPENVRGNCTTLLGGRKACRSDVYLDPLTTECD